MNKNKSLSLALILLMFSSAHALSIKEAVDTTLKNNPKIKSLRENSLGYKYYVDEAYGDFLPKINYEGFIEDKKVRDTTKSSGSTTIYDENGSNQQLKLEQNIYDGGRTLGKVQEAKHNQQATFLSNLNASETVILDTVLAYLDYLRNEELRLLTENSLEVQNHYLETAIETEKVSGDKADRLQVENKILTVKEKLLQYKLDAFKFKKSIEKNILKDIDLNICRPNIQKELIPKTIDELLTQGVKNNYKVLEEIENVRAQRAIISQEIARFLPSIDVRLLKEIDDGIDTETLKKNNQSARITLKYNFFNGFKDKAVYQREKIFLNEAQERLDNLTNEAKEFLLSEYETFIVSKEKIDLYKEHVDKSKEILNLYVEQFDGGTRSFIDVLTQEEELYRKKIDLIEEEFKNLVSYYTLLNRLSMLSNSIINSTNQVCDGIKIDKRVIAKKTEVISDELQNLLLGDDNSDLNSSDLNLEQKQLNEETKLEEPNNIKDKVNDVFNSILNDIYNQKDVETINVNKEIKIKSVPKKEMRQVDEEFISNDNEDFFNGKEKKYTITLATFLSEEFDLEEYLKRHRLTKDIFTYEIISNNKKYIRILYGVFNSSLEAKNAMEAFSKILKNNNPYVSKVKTHEKIYHKYNSSSGE